MCIIQGHRRQCQKFRLIALWVGGSSRWHGFARNNGVWTNKKHRQIASNRWTHIYIDSHISTLLSIGSLKPTWSKHILDYVITKKKMLILPPMVCPEADESPSKLSLHGSTASLREHETFESGVTLVDGVGLRSRCPRFPDPELQLLLDTPGVELADAMLLARAFLLLPASKAAAAACMCWKLHMKPSRCDGFIGFPKGYSHLGWSAGRILMKCIRGEAPTHYELVKCWLNAYFW